MPNKSPWIDQLKNQRETNSLTKNHLSDISIIGAGIAGVSTAYFILKNTNFNVALIEAGKAAHGATGHNAGQLVSYFELQVSELVKQYGLELTAQAQSAIDLGWILIEKIFADTKITTPLAQFTGYAGCQSLDQLIVHLENIIFCRQANIQTEPIIIANDIDILKDIPEKYYGLYTTLPQKDILTFLETDDPSFIAVVSARKGCMNSALFCEDLLHHMLQKYSDRFVLLEHSPVSEVILKKDFAILKVKDNEIHSGKVVLCTNGFENFKITNTVGDDIDKNFHQLVKGSIGYMAGYLEPHERPPVAISYLPKSNLSGDDAFDSEPYFYLTRRGFDKNQSLICIGGPEVLVENTEKYLLDDPYLDDAEHAIDKFLHKTYKFAPKGKIDYKYKWHGLMGYTPNGVRCIGPEPLNNVLYYNLGCNGVGILPSVYGAEKISRFLKGEMLERSIFDPGGVVV